MGPVAYAFGSALAWVSAPAAFVCYAAIAAYFVLPRDARAKRRDLDRELLVEEGVRPADDLSGLRIDDVVDDDSAVRDALALLIGSVGLRAQTWADPQAFLEQYAHQAKAADAAFSSAVL